jgi:hypothetical protein
LEWIALWVAFNGAGEAFGVAQFVVEIVYALLLGVGLVGFAVGGVVLLVVEGDFVLDGG